MGGKRVKTYRRRLLDALFETNRNLAKLHIKVLNLATVDAPGVIISSCGDLVSMNCALMGAV